MARGVYRLGRSDVDGATNAFVPYPRTDNFKRSTNVAAEGLAAVLISSMPGRFYRAMIQNASATTGYTFMVFDKSTAPVNGDTPVYSKQLPVSGECEIDLTANNGVPCTKAIWVAISTTGGTLTLATSSDMSHRTVIYTRTTSPAIDPTALAVPAINRWSVSLGSTVSGGKVTALTDLVGYVGQAQATPANQPTYNASDAAYGGKSSMSLGTAWWFDHQGTVASIAAPISVLLVGYISGGAVWISSSTSVPPYDLMWTKADGSIQFFTGSGSITSPVSTITGPCAVLLTDNGTASSLYVNDFANPVATGATLWGAATYIDIGRTSAGVGNALGSMAEVIVYGGALGASDRATLRSYVAQTYKL